MNNMILCPQGNPTKCVFTAQYMWNRLCPVHASGELAAGPLLCWAGRCKCQQHRKWKSTVLQAGVHHPPHLLIRS